MTTFSVPEDTDGNCAPRSSDKVDLPSKPITPKTESVHPHVGSPAIYPTIINCDGPILAIPADVLEAIPVLADALTLGRLSTHELLRLEVGDPQSLFDVFAIIKNGYVPQISEHSNQIQIHAYVQCYITACQMGSEFAQNKLMDALSAFYHAQNVIEADVVARLSDSDLKHCKLYSLLLQEMAYYFCLGRYRVGMSLLNHDLSEVYRVSLSQLAQDDLIELAHQISLSATRTKRPTESARQNPCSFHVHKRTTSCLFEGEGISLGNNLESQASLMTIDDDPGNSRKKCTTSDQQNSRKKQPVKFRRRVIKEHQTVSQQDPCEGKGDTVHHLAPRSTESPTAHQEVNQPPKHQPSQELSTRRMQAPPIFGSPAKIESKLSLVDAYESLTRQNRSSATTTGFAKYVSCEPSFKTSPRTASWLTPIPTDKLNEPANKQQSSNLIFTQQGRSLPSELPVSLKFNESISGAKAISEHISLYKRANAAKLKLEEDQREQIERMERTEQFARARAVSAKVTSWLIRLQLDDDETPKVKHCDRATARSTSPKRTSAHVKSSSETSSIPKILGPLNKAKQTNATQHRSS